MRTIVLLVITLSLGVFNRAHAQEQDSTDLQLDTVRNTQPATELPEVEKKKSDDEVFIVVEQMPEFPGGEDALLKFISDSIVYPDEAREAGLEGRVIATFIVDTAGNITNVRIANGIGMGCDEEVLRVINSMPRWIPGKQRGKPVQVQYALPVKFQLTRRFRLFKRRNRD